MNQKTTITFADLTPGTEFYFCDPETVGGNVILPRFKKVSAGAPPSFQIAGVLNLLTRERKLVSRSSFTWHLPVWPQPSTPESSSLKEEFQKAGERIRALEAENIGLRATLARTRRQLLFIGNQKD